MIANGEEGGSTSSDIGDAPMLPELLGQIASHHEVASVSSERD